MRVAHNSKFKTQKFLMRVAHNSKLKIQNSQFNFLPPRHSHLDSLDQLLKSLSRLEEHPEHVSFAHDDAPVLKVEGPVAGAYGGAVGHGGQVALIVLVALQFDGVGARRQKVVRMLQCGAYLALVDKQGALNTVLRIVVSYDFYSHK